MRLIIIRSKPEHSYLTILEEFELEFVLLVYLITENLLVNVS